MLGHNGAIGFYHTVQALRAELKDFPSWLAAGRKRTGEMGERLTLEMVKVGTCASGSFAVGALAQPRPGAGRG